MIRKLTIGDFEKVEPMMAARIKFMLKTGAIFILKMRIRLLKRNLRRCLKTRTKLP